MSLLLLLIAITCLSQFYRVSNSVIAPDLVRDLHLTARELGWAGSAFFLAVFAVQLPVGLWFDRFGARRTVSTVSLLAVVGAVWISFAANATDLIAARIVMGLGCAASFMSVVFLWCALVRAGQAHDGAVLGLRGVQPRHSSQAFHTARLDRGHRGMAQRQLPRY